MGTPPLKRNKTMFTLNQNECIDSNLNQDIPDQKSNDSKTVNIARLKIAFSVVCTIGMIFIIGKFLYKNVPAQMPTSSAADFRKIMNGDLLAKAKKAKKAQAAKKAAVKK